MKNWRRGVALGLIICLLAGLLGCIRVVPTPSSNTNEESVSEEDPTGTARPTEKQTRESSETEKDKSETESESESETETETETETEPESTYPPISPNIGLTALARVGNYVNVRRDPSTKDENGEARTDNIVGKIFNNCAADILDEVPGEDGNWFLISSGNVTGYVKAEFFVVGAEAEALRAEVGVLQGTVVVENGLRVRSEPDTSDPNNITGVFEYGTTVFIRELKNGWAKIEADADYAGYVKAESQYLSIKRVFKTAITLEEEAEEIARKERAEEKARQEQLALEQKQREEAEAAARVAAAEAAARAAAEAAAQAAAAEKAAAEKAAAEAERELALLREQEAQARNDSLMQLRYAVVAYALQFVGYPYSHQNASLTTGVDCSSFTRLVYKHFGWTGAQELSWIPAGQANQGVDVPLDQLLPGDLLFYPNSTNAGIAHVAMYIGDGKIVHAGTFETGICVMNAFYRQPHFARRIIN